MGIDVADLIVKGETYEHDKNDCDILADDASARVWRGRWRKHHGYKNADNG